jgi:hypothetical protein
MLFQDNASRSVGLPSFLWNLCKVHILRALFSSYGLLSLKSFVLTWTFTPQKHPKYVNCPYHICPHSHWDQLLGLESKDMSISFLCGPVAHCLWCNSMFSIGRQTPKQLGYCQCQCHWHDVPHIGGPCPSQGSNPCEHHTAGSSHPILVPVVDSN